jgi:hypothetical protein
MPIESGMDMLLLLLYAKGATEKVNEPIQGITRLEKLIFLLNQIDIFHKYFSDYNFEPYDFGPFSSELYDDIEILKDENLVETNKISTEYFVEISDAEKAMEEQRDFKENIIESDEKQETEIYELSENGKKVANILFNELSSREKNLLEEIKKEFNSISLFQLIRYVYLKYPESTAYSKIREKILGRVEG